MESPDKIKQRLDELLAPPGPESDPLELTFRSMIHLSAPMIQGAIDQYAAQDLDHWLELVAYFFLAMRSDGRALSQDFLDELAKYDQPQPAELNAPAAEPAPEAAPAVDPTSSGSSPPSSETLPTDSTGSAASSTEPPPPAPPWGG